LDEELVRSIFLQVDVERILRIPLSHHMPDDFVALHYTKNFCFSIRSAYHIQWEHLFGHMTIRRDGHGSAQINQVWDSLWKLNIPSKVKIFLWKALHGVLPGVAILAGRHIKVSPQCPICKSGPEDICHILCGCLRAKEIWSELGLTDVIEHALLADRSGSVILEYILRSPNKNVPNLEQVTLHELIAVGGLYIWWQRREAVKGERVSPPKSSAFAIKSLTANFGVSQGKSMEKEFKWLKLTRGKLKLNTDASYFADGSGAAGGVLRNDKGEVMAGYYCPLVNMLSPATAEATTMLRGFELLEKLGCTSCQVEMVSL
jgi:hypothetical protein